MLSPRRVVLGYVLGAPLVALSGLAWATLWMWEHAPASHAVHHLAAVSDEQRLLLPFVAAWMVMVVAMMLPTQLPLLVTLLRNTRGTYLILFGGSLIGGYLAAWALYGVAVFAGTWLLQQAVTALPWLHRQAWAFGALSLIVAGLYQFTPAKRSLLQSIHADHHGSARQRHTRVGTAGAVTLGLRHGVCCVGCCWSLMLLMLGDGDGMVGWMLTWGTIMALERTLKWGPRLVAPLGGALIVSGALVLVLVGLVRGPTAHGP